MYVVMEGLDNYQKLARKVILEAIQDYYNYLNNKGNRFSKREGAKIKSWVGTDDFNFWCDVFGIDNSSFRRAFERFLDHIDKGGSLKNLNGRL